MNLVQKHFPELENLTDEQMRDIENALVDREIGIIVDIHTYENSFSGIDYKNEHGQYDRKPNHGPAVKAWHKNGQIADVSYYTQDMLNRDPNEGPARCGWYENGQKAAEIFSMDGKQHRDYLQGPAEKTWDEKGNLETEMYMQHGQFHRDPQQGPAYRTFYYGKIEKMYYWEGQVVDKNFVPPSMRPIPDGLGRIFV